MKYLDSRTSINAFFGIKCQNFLILLASTGRHWKQDKQLGLTLFVNLNGRK